MDTSNLTAKSALAVDIGTTITRSLLFDVVSGRYRLIGGGQAPTTAGAPKFDVIEGVWRSLDQLQSYTGRSLLDKEGVIIPSTQDNQGVDLMVATMSAGNPISVVTVGLLDNVSLQNAQRLAQTSYTEIIAEISLNDRRSATDRINLLTRKRPDLIIITGGTNNGATQSLLSILESIGLASFLIEESQRPHILFAGNEVLQDEVKSGLEKISNLHISPNIQPVLGLTNFRPAQKEINEIFHRVRRKQSGGLHEVLSWTDGYFTSTATALGRVIRFLSEKYEPEKGVLGVDVGSDTTILAAAFHGEETLRVYPNTGVGGGAGGVLDRSSLQEIKRWLPIKLPNNLVRDYIYNKSTYPDSIPTEEEHLEIELAIAKQALRQTSLDLIPSLDKQIDSMGILLPGVEPIIGGGRVLTEAPHRYQSLSVLLDGLQPTGVTTLAIDQNGVLPGLGALAEINPLMTVQVIESNTFLNLGTIIAPIGIARPGTPVLRIRLYREDGREITRDVKYGSLTILPVGMGEKVSLHLRPLHRFDIGMGGPGKSGKVNAVGGVLGIIVDTRGRPLQFLPDEEKNIERNLVWKKTLQKYA
jgi:uncharacterized protein (TIGR01319 family)